MNKALHDADRELEQNTHRQHGHRAEVGKAYAVAVSAKSSLAAQGVTHVIHVLGPNMNPERPLCLNGNYELGCTLLASAYTSLFNVFLSLRAQILKRRHAPLEPPLEGKRPAAASPPKVRPARSINLKAITLVPSACTSACAYTKQWPRWWRWLGRRSDGLHQASGEARVRYVCTYNVE